MKLFNGVQYSEQRPGGKSSNSRPFVRTSFKTYTKVFDLSEFNLSKTNTKLFSTNRTMLATWQLQIGIDSIDADIAIRKQAISNYMTNYLPMLEQDTTVYRSKQAEDEVDPTKYNTRPVDILEEETVSKRDSARRELNASVGRGTTIEAIDNRSKNTIKPVPKEQRMIMLQDRRVEARAKALANPLVTGAENWDGIVGLMDSVETTIRGRVLNRTRSSVRSVSSQAKAAERILPGIRESRVKHIYDLHMKYSMALVCIIFIFIGAPMGAIVRKGGFGYPILVSIIFFVIFIILTIFCRKLAESFVVDAAFAGWLPCVILFPVSLYITARAMKDAKLVNLESVTSAFSTVIKKLRGTKSE
jgi:lipopolysaccharide export system permease protein